MGNRQGHNKEESKPKGDKTNEKEAQKGSKQKDKPEKRKKQLGHNVVELDTDFDESSHVTGGDSESCVFHSAENISFSPYLDSSTRSEHEQVTAWPGVLEQASLDAQHPYVLSSKDFQDGFSLEACIPSEIARLENHNDVSSPAKSRYGHRNPSLNSSTVAQPGAELKAGFSGSKPPVTGEFCNNFSATSSSLTGTAERLKAPVSPIQTPVHNFIRTESQEKQPPSPAGGQHHPHFYNHNRKYQNTTPLPVTKPTSPQPQRRTLSPKISSPFKNVPSDHPSPGPSTPGPQRRAANFLALFRSSSKREKAATKEDGDSKTDSTSDETRGRSYSTSNDSDRKVKSKPAWKTWERPRSKKSKKPIKDSIFGTSRKSDKKPGKDDAGDNTQAANKEKLSEVAVGASGNLLPLDTDTRMKQKETQNKPTTAVQTVQKYDQVSPAISSSQAKSNNEKVSSTEGGQVTQARSPPLSSTAAVCIMKLEELERSIEKTIREKFPDAEPFLITKRSKEELHGSRSLPTTPSNKKKLHLVRDEDALVASSRQNNKDATRYYNETYETPQSPSMSPVVIRRFGARTRHASISPKTQRAKTAALFNSPSEMSSFDTPRAKQMTTHVPLYHRLSSDQAAHPEVTKPFSAAQKSESKYDNVMGDDDTSTSMLNPDNYYHHRHGLLTDNNREQVNETSTDDNTKTGGEQSQVIIPTFSAVFGSVSPKLRRHLQVKFDEINDNIDEDKTQIDEDVQLPNHSSTTETNRTASNGSNKNDRRVTQAGLNSSPVCIDSSVIALGLIKPQEKRPEEIISKFAAQSEEKANKERSEEQSHKERSEEQSHKERHKASEIIGAASVADRTQAIYNSVPNEAEEEKLISFEHRTTPASAVASSGAKITAKSGQLGSSATKRTHSTNHVLLFESAVPSPPDRSVPTALLPQSSPEQESTCSGKNSHIAQAQVTSHQGHNCRYASEQNTVDSQQGEAPRSQPDFSSSLSSAGDRNLSHTATDSRETRADLSPAEVTADVLSQQRDLVSVGRTQNGQALVIRTSEPDCASLDKRVESNDSSDCLSSVVKHKNVNVFSNSGTNANRLVEQSVSVQKKPDQAQLYKFGQDEDRVSVFKQPVSEVISQMISRSKLQPQQHERHCQQQHQQQQQRQRRNITSPDIAVIQPQLVTVQKYEQLSEVLERRSVHAPVDSTHAPVDSTSADVSDELCQSKCQEIQTDSYTTADKSVDSHGLVDAAENVGFSKIVQTANSLAAQVNLDQEVAEEEQADGIDNGTANEFLKMSSSESKKQERKPAGESSMSEHVPPPSPTALRQLMEEFEEEEDDGMDGQAMATTNREQREMKEFSDIIYKRLSELLGNRPEHENDIESSHVTDNDETKDLDSEKEGLSKCEVNSETTACDNNDIITRTETCASITTGFPMSPLVKILTVDTSSSLTTTTSSESDIDEAPLMFHSFQKEENNDDGAFKNTDDYDQRKEEESDRAFREFDEPKLVKSDDVDCKPTSREYHSDDDVAKGRGIPDYYDDKPLWSRRQKPPGQLSATMLAIRWRERRERWLKKRRRNRTDLMSTGSSDTGSEYCLNRDNEPTDENYFVYDQDDEKTKRINEMGSGILTSPKYTKPILPFFDNQLGSAELEVSSHVHSSVHRRQRQDSRSRSNRSGYSLKHQSPNSRQNDKDFKHQSPNSRQNDKDFKHQSPNSRQNDNSDRKYVNTRTDNKDRENGNKLHARNSAGVKPDKGAPSIEDTFQELLSVQTILKEMQECRSSVDDVTNKQVLLPLTTENVRSIREYYKDFYTSGNGRRSRMSATDRTESDLDLYSEIQDDASSESDLYADDEGDDEGQEPYATAEDDAGGATGRGSSTSCRSSKRDEGRLDKDDEDDSDTSLVLSCTFYNSNTHQQKVADTTEIGPTAIYALETKTTHRSISAPQVPTSHASLNSDDEFWTGSAVIDESYKQLETAADAVSSTFQNAREQMHDIQYHLQALRRQMEVMQDDLTNVSLSLSQSTSTEFVKK